MREKIAISDNRIIGILMHRDGITKEEAEEVFEDVQNNILNAEDFEDVEGVLNGLGLEMDYFEDLI